MIRGHALVQTVRRGHYELGWRLIGHDDSRLRSTNCSRCFGTGSKPTVENERATIGDNATPPLILSQESAGRGWGGHRIIGSSRSQGIGRNGTAHAHGERNALQHTLPDAGRHTTQTAQQIAVSAFAAESATQTSGG